MPTGVKRDFDSYVVEQGKCLVWTGCVSSSGYGNVRRDGVNTTAHRFAWARARGPIPPGVLIAHHCDNKLCVRVSHLFAGSQLDNMRDCKTKGRHARGEGHGEHKLSDREVDALRDRARSGESQRLIAKRYRISQAQVSRLVNYQRRALGG